MRAEEMNALFDSCIADYHQQDNVDTAMSNPFQSGGIEHDLYQKCWIDTVQWHLEDIIRNPDIDPTGALVIKRRIDKSNQERTDMVERIDDRFMEMLHEVEPHKDAKVNTESIAWAIDRLSILALKLYHMKIEAERSDLSNELSQKNQHKYSVLRTQRNDLSLAINQLLDDLNSGQRIMKVYRQMKMYNDPELNPVLYSRKND